MELSLKLNPRTDELKPQHNEPGSSSTRENALEYDPDPYTLMNVRVETVQYGKYKDQPAALIVFRFIVKFRPASRRISSFHVNIEFRNGSGGNNAGGLSHPRVIKLAPEERRGRVFTEERSNTIRPGMQVPLSHSGAQVGVDGEIARKINREYEMKLSGWKKSSDAGPDNVLVWDCTEAKKVARGVVPGYRAAAIVTYQTPGPMAASLNLDVERGAFNFVNHLFDYTRLFAKKEWDDPLTFDPSKPMGIQYPGLGDFKDLDLEQFILLEPIKTVPEGYS